MMGAFSDCPLCDHDDAAEIDAAIRSGMAPPAVARRYGVSALAVFAHKRHVAMPKPEPSSEAEPAPSSEPAPVAPVAPPKPAKPKPSPKRGQAFSDLSPSEYRHLWTMFPNRIYAQLTHEERRDPALNPLHMFANSEPPEELARRRVPTGRELSASSGSFSEMERRRDRGEIV